MKAVKVQTILDHLQPSVVVIEAPATTPNMADVARLRTVAAIVAKAATAQQLIVSLVCSAALWCQARNIPCHCLAPSALKKYATGVGNSGKQSMIIAANETFALDLPVEDHEKTGVDNVADALWLCKYGVDNFSVERDL
jgi:Holliday junction resolvasome RuvABC endonuclease subunit